MDKLGTYCSTSGSGQQNVGEGFECFQWSLVLPLPPLCFVMSGIAILDVWKSL